MGRLPEPLQFSAADDPVSCALYTKDKNLLDQPGWKRFNNIAKQEKLFTLIINQAICSTHQLITSMIMKFLGISGKMLWYWNYNKIRTIRLLRTKVITHRTYHHMDARRFASI
jgi:hypothetical protein